VGAGDAERLLTEAERVASGLPEPGDDRAHALCEVQLGAVRVRPGDQDRFLAGAENYARAIADKDRRMGALNRLARVAARIDPLRAAQIGDTLYPLQQYPVAVLIAYTDPVQAIQLLARSGNHYLAPVEKTIAATETDPARLVRALSKAKPAAGQPLEFIQAIMLAAFIDVDWAEKALRSIRADTWRGYPGQTSYVRLGSGQLEYMQAAGLADLADLLLGNWMMRD